MQVSASSGQQVSTQGQVDAVVDVPPVSGAASRCHDTGVAQLGQVVRDEVLRLPHQFGQLPDATVATRKFGEQTPPVRVSDERQDRWRCIDGHQQQYYIKCN
jgi:hypothetical protein